MGEEQKTGREFIKTAVINFTKYSETSTIASTRIATYLSRLTGAQFIDSKESCFISKYETIFIVNGPMLFCNFREHLVALCQANKDSRFIWVGNDYMIKLPSQLNFIKNEKFEIWSAYEIPDSDHKHQLVNWNSLTFTPNLDLKPKTFSDGLIYFGAFRKGREKSFKKYLSQEAPYKVHISCSARARGSFFEVNKNAEFHHPFSDVITGLSPFLTTLYIEDETSHRLYCSPANRFYESLSAGALILFDRSCQSTFSRAGFDVGAFTVDSVDDVARALSGAQALLKEQRVRFYHKMDYKAVLDAQVQKLLRA